MSREYSPEPEPKNRRLFSLRVFLVIVLIGFAVPVAYGGWQELYGRFLELTAPTIEFIEFPRGVGLAPVRVRFRVADEGAGLSEVVVRLRQRGQYREILRRSLDGRNSSEETLSFPGQESGLEEGMAYLEIRTFDRSLWSNRAEKSAELRIDFRKPKIEVLSKQHNARRGGSQMVIYKVYDEDLAYSGVKVGTRVFQGYLARGLDKTFEDPNLYVAFYAIDLAQSPDQVAIRVFADDAAGNGASMPFYNKVQDRSQRATTVTLKEDFMRDQVIRLVEQNFRKLSAYSDQYERPAEGVIVDPLIAKFRLLNEILRRVNENELSHILETSPRFESFLQNFFLKPAGTVHLNFGDLVTYRYQEQELGTATMLGVDLGSPRGTQVYATNDGVAMLSENAGMYGRMVAIDHGLGISSVYGQLSEVLVKRGETVKKGQAVGTIGATGFARGNSLYFEMRIQGVPVDPGEWWDPNWFKQHVLDKINDAKRELGIPVYTPFG